MSKSYYIIPVFISHEGCPHQCVFCNQNKIAGQYKGTTAKEVSEKVDNYLKTINSKGATIEVSFFGGTFTAIPEYKQRELLEVSKYYKDINKIQKIRLSTRPDAINEHILNYLKEYGVDVIELGVQSLNEDVLKRAGRGHTAIHVENASKLIKEFGFVLGHQIMPGLPGDTFEKDIETARKSLAMKPDICRIYPALIVKDTPMEEMYKRGEYKPYTLEQAVEISSEILSLYKEKKVKVIRIGLQPTDSINYDGDVIDGPFHPAFRELVESYSIYKKLQRSIQINKDIIIEINEKEISKLYANKKQYYNNFISSRTGKVHVKIQNKLKRGKIKVTVIERTEEIKY